MPSEDIKKTFESLGDYLIQMRGLYVKDTPEYKTLQTYIDNLHDRIEKERAAAVNTLLAYMDSAIQAKGASHR